MKVNLAKHYGMCFGVRDAIHATRTLAAERPLTVLGQLVHNPTVQNQLRELGVGSGDLGDLRSSGTTDVVVTAHGASDSDRRRWSDAGFRVRDTTCPLVKRAHHALGLLVARGFFPVVIGKRDHVEVRGLVGDFPHAAVIESDGDLSQIPPAEKIGIVSQTTQPLAKVLHLVAEIGNRHPRAVIEFKDTVCQPTKDRQGALEDLCSKNPVVVVVGGANSNNTAQLARTVELLGARAYQIAGPTEIDPLWFQGVDSVGVTAGTSTLEETVQAVCARLREIADSKAPRTNRAMTPGTPDTKGDAHKTPDCQTSPPSPLSPPCNASSPSS